MALHLGRGLESIGVPCEVVVMSREELAAFYIEHYKEENGCADFKGMGERFAFDYNHILIKFKSRGRTYFADSGGVHSSFSKAVKAFGADQRYEVYGVGLDDLEQEVKVKGNWNTRFQRKQIPGIRATIAKHLRQYRKNNRKWRRIV